METNDLTITIFHRGPGAELGAAAGEFSTRNHGCGPTNEKPLPQLLLNQAFILDIVIWFNWAVISFHG